MISRTRCDCHRVPNGCGQLSTSPPKPDRGVSRESGISIGHGVKGSMKAPIVGVQGWKALTASNRRTVGLSGEAGFQGAGTPLLVMGCRGAGTLCPTGDATAIRCTGFDGLLNCCHCQQRWHLGKRMESRRGRSAGGDATGHAQRVPLAKVAMVLPSTPCGSR